MIEPLLADNALLADISNAKAAPGLHIWWLGQSGFLVQWDGRHLLFDPYLSDSLTRKYADTDKPHVQMTRRPVDPARLDFVDVVTSSHNHTDHLDGETLRALLDANATLTVVVPAANREFAADRLQVPTTRLTEIDADQTIETCDLKVHALPAAHEDLERDDQGRYRFLGYVVELGPWTLYHSGDTVRYEGMAERLQAWDIDVAFLPINGRLPERRVAGNLWGEESVKLASEAGAKLVIPCHFEMFEFNTVTPDAFVEAAKAAGQGYRVLKCGERFTA